MLREFPLARAELIALFIESLVFGVFTVLCALSIWILLSRERGRAEPRTRLNKMLIATSAVMWLLSATHMCLDVQRAVGAFVHSYTTADGPELFYSVLSSPTFVAKNTIYITNTLVGDAFMAYRLYVIWDRAWWIAVPPAALILATAVSGYGAMAACALTRGHVSIFDPAIRPWLRTFFALSLATNLLASGLIAGRIMHANRQIRRESPAAAAASRWEVIETVVQSAAIYSAVIASLLGTYLAGSNGQYIALDALQPLIGVVFTIIITRLGLGYTLTDLTARVTAASAHHNHNHTSTFRGRAFPARSVPHSHSNHLPLGLHSGAPSTAPDASASFVLGAGRAEREFGLLDADAKGGRGHGHSHSHSHSPSPMNSMRDKRRKGSDVEVGDVDSAAGSL